MFTNIQARLEEQLLEITTHLSLAQHVGLSIVEKVDVLCALKDSVEEIRIHRILKLQGRQTIGTANVMRDIRCFTTGSGKHALIERHKEYIFKIKVPRLQYTHDLQPAQRLSTERYLLRTHELAEKSKKGFQCLSLAGTGAIGYLFRQHRLEQVEMFQKVRGVFLVELTERR